MWMFRFAALAAVLSACSSTFYSETEDEVRVTSGVGGFVLSINERYNAWEASGKRLVIDGPVASADAFAAFSVPGACYTPNAVFQPHAISHFGIVPNARVTMHYASYLPPPLRDWFVESPWFHNPVMTPHLGYERLLELWPEGACPSEDDTRRWLREDR